jgi:hypothetical protein
MSFVLVEHIDEALDLALIPLEEAQCSEKKDDKQQRQAKAA